MIEVFKTNVREQHHAARIVEEIHRSFTEYKANFDLDDCDNILRVKCPTGQIMADSLINLINAVGFDAEVLSEEASITIR